jgi:hypothetical protein
MFTTFAPRPLAELAPLWAAKIPKLNKVFGHSAFGDLFVCTEDENYIAILMTERPELIQLKFESKSEFEEKMLADPAIQRGLFRGEDYAALVERLGALQDGNCFYAVPYRALGGSGDLATFQQGNIWVHLHIYGQALGFGK